MFNYISPNMVKYISDFELNTAKNKRHGCVCFEKLGTIIYNKIPSNWISITWDFQECPGWDSNSHGQNSHYPLKVARLPIPPPRQTIWMKLEFYGMSISFCKWKLDSSSRWQPWFWHKKTGYPISCIRLSGVQDETRTHTAETATTPSK